MIKFGNKKGSQKMCIKKEALSTKIVALEDGEEVNYLLKK